MNKIILSALLLLILISCVKKPLIEKSEEFSTSDKKSISISQAMNMIKSETFSRQSLVATKTISIDYNAISVGCLQTTDVSGVKIFPTHGYVRMLTPYSNTDSKELVGSTSYVPGQETGSGYAIKYPFKYGATYTVKIEVRQIAVALTGDKPESIKRRPSIEAQLTNDAPTSQECYDHAPVNLSGTDPVQTFAASPANDKASYSSVSFIPSKCYDYVRFNILPNRTGESLGVVFVSSIVIEETPALELLGPATINLHEQGTYSVSYNGFPIGAEFNWRVTGDLQILNNPISSSVIIQSTGLNGGAIYVSINGCDILTKILPSNQLFQPIITGPNSIVGNRSYTYTISNPSPGATSYSWRVTGGAELIGRGSSANIIFEDTNTATTLNLYVKANGNFGSTSEGSFKIGVKPCPTCPK